jgi:glutaminase
VDLTLLLDKIILDVEDKGARGTVADYIPALARVDPSHFGMAIAELDGTVHGVGDWQHPFSIQSMSKVFTLALVLAQADGADVWRRVGREPSGDPFNSLVQLEHEDGIPRNPFINAGALVVTDELARYGDAADELLTFLRTESGDPGLTVDAEVAASEAEHADRNRALAYFMAAYGNIRHPVPEVLDQYVRQCSIAMSCGDLARSALFLARHGIRNDGSRFIGQSEAKRINAVMLTCGTYDAAGQFAYRVGLPAKSGVGGGILAIVPGRCAVCVWSPGLDKRGNSVAGATALARFTTMTGWSIF